MCVKPRMNWNQAAAAQHCTLLDAQPLQIQVSDFTKFSLLLLGGT